MSPLPHIVASSLLAGLVSLVTLAGCGDNSLQERPHPVNLVPDGTFVLDYVDAEGFTLADFKGVSLTVDRREMSATLSGTPLPAPLMMPLVAVAEAEWPSDCYTNGDSYSINELFRLGEGPISVGELDIDDPALTTACGGRVLLGTMTQDVANDAFPVLGFVP